MSIKNWILSTSAFGLVIGAGLSFKIKSESAQNRLPVSTKMTKFQPQRFQISKPRQNIEVQIDVVGGFPSSNNETATLRAVVRADQALKEVIDYQWILPEGASIVRGTSRGLIQNVNPEQELIFEIEVLGFSSEGMPRNITFETSSQRGGALVGSSVVLSSHPTRSDLSISFRPTKKDLEKAEEALQTKTMAVDDEAPEQKHRAPASKNIHY